MQIQAYRRTAKTPVNLLGVDVLFEPNTLGHVVAEVADERVCERLLSISEAYREYLGEGAPIAVVVAPAPAAAPAAPPGGSDDDDKADGDKTFDAVLLGSEDLPAEFTIAEGVTVTQAAVVDLAFTKSGMNREEWNLNDADDREGLIENQVTALVIEQEQIAKAAADAAAAALPPPPPAVPVADQATTQNAPDAPVVEANPLVITNDAGETLDLSKMTEKALREFATANSITLPGGKATKVADLRLMVAKALTAE